MRLYVITHYYDKPGSLIAQRFFDRTFTYNNDLGYWLYIRSVSV